MVFTRTWNTAYEALPADGDLAREGAARIRDLKEDIRERMEEGGINWDADGLGPALDAAGYIKQAFPSGTKMLFVQTSAPTGWTKDTDENDKALRIVSGTPSTGGGTAFSSVFGSGKNTGSTALTLSHLPSSQQYPKQSGYTNQTVNNGIPWFAIAPSDMDQGGGAGHTHSLSLNLQYVDVIKATKD